MEQVELARLLEGLKNERGDALIKIFRDNASYCINGLLKKHNCLREDAEDIYTDAVLNFRSRLLGGKVTYLTDIRSYLFATCNNMYLAQLKRNERTNRAVLEINHLHEKTDHAFENGSSAFREEMLQMTEAALDTLQGRCQQILKSFYFHQKSLEEIASQFNMANANVAKVSKARCFQKLVSYVRSVQQNKSLESNATK